MATTLQYTTDTQTVDDVTTPINWLAAPTVLSTGNSGDDDGLLDAGEFNTLYLRFLLDGDEGSTFTATVEGIDTPVTFTKVGTEGSQVAYVASIDFPGTGGVYEGDLDVSFTTTTTSTTTVTGGITNGNGGNPERVKITGIFITGDAANNYKLAAGTYVFSWTSPAGSYTETITSDGNLLLTTVATELNNKVSGSTTDGIWESIKDGNTPTLQLKNNVNGDITTLTASVAITTTNTTTTTKTVFIDTKPPEPDFVNSSNNDPADAAEPFYGAVNIGPDALLRLDNATVGATGLSATAGSSYLEIDPSQGTDPNATSLKWEFTYVNIGGGQSAWQIDINGNNNLSPFPDGVYTGTLVLIDRNGNRYVDDDFKINYYTTIVQPGDVQFTPPDSKWQHDIASLPTLGTVYATVVPGSTITISLDGSAETYDEDLPFTLNGTALEWTPTRWDPAVDNGDGTFGAAMPIALVNLEAPLTFTISSIDPNGKTFVSKVIYGGHRDYSIDGDAASPFTVVNDDLSGTQYADLIFGYDGDDVIDAGKGNDWVFGGQGKDSIIAGFGDDRVAGGTQADRISLGEGLDTIVYSRFNESSASERDFITDFVTTDDKIDMANVFSSLGLAFTFLASPPTRIRNAALGSMWVEKKTYTGDDPLTTDVVETDAVYTITTLFGKFSNGSQANFGIDFYGDITLTASNIIA